MKPRRVAALIMVCTVVVALGVLQLRGHPGARARAGAPAPQAPTSTATAEDASHSERSPSEEGARAAAIGYASASQDWLYLTDDEIDRAVRAIATPAAADALSRSTVEELHSARDGLAKASGRVWWLVRPLASRVERFDGANAHVIVWAVTVLSAADVALPQADWMRVAVDLQWVNDGWRVQAVADAPGPTPMVGTKDRPWQPEPFDESLDGFERVGSEARS